MAKVNGMFGTGLSGKVGNMVYYQYKGKDCMRSLPGKRKTEGTPKQTLNRQRFLKLVMFTKQFKFVLIPQIWNQATKTMSGFQYFMKTNSVAFNTEGIITDLKLVKLSVGTLELPSDITLRRVENDPGYLMVNWVEDYYNGGVPYWDELIVISYAEGLFSDIKYTGIRRGDLQGVFELPELAVPATHIYLFFASLERINYSESICIEI